LSTATAPRRCPTLSLHDALPICSLPMLPILAGIVVGSQASPRRGLALAGCYAVSMALVYAALGVVAALLGANLQGWLMQPCRFADRKSTRLNSSHVKISYAVFCL